MEIQGTGPIQGPKRIDKNRPAAAARAAAGSSAGGTGDTVEISAAGRLRGALATVPDVRMEKVERIRAEIAAGTYETPEKLEVAVDRLLGELI